MEFRRAAGAGAAVAAAAGLGGHEVFEADVPGLLHKSAVGAVELELHGAEEVRAAMDRLRARFAGRMSGVLVEPIIAGGIETLAGVAQEPVFGPVVVFGLGGITTGVLANHAARLAPLTDADAKDLIRGIRAAPALLEHAPGTAALRDALLLRVSRLADDLPQVAELDLNPVIVRPVSVIAVDARIRVTSEHLADPFLRRLPRDRWQASRLRSGPSRREGPGWAGNPGPFGIIGRFRAERGRAIPSRSGRARPLYPLPHCDTGDRASRKWPGTAARTPVPLVVGPAGLVHGAPYPGRAESSITSIPGYV